MAKLDSYLVWKKTGDSKQSLVGHGAVFSSRTNCCIVNMVVNGGVDGLNQTVRHVFDKHSRNEFR